MTLLVEGLSLINNSKSNIEYSSKIKKVNGIKLNADFSNIKIVSQSPDLSINIQGKKTLLGEPKIDITYSKDKAIINVLTFNKFWKKILPGKIGKSNILLNIPPSLLEDIHMATNIGNIDVDQVTGAIRLSLISGVGTIRMNSFQGELLNINAGNGSIHLGEVDGQINIRNKVGSLKSLVLKNMKGKNNIKISNGNVKVQLPDMKKMDDIGLNI